MSRLCRSGSVLASALLLGVAVAATTPTLTFLFKSPGTSTSGASGQLTVRSLSALNSVSVLTLRGLAPSTAYVAHYHALGSVSSAPCASDGPITLGFPAFRTNAQGQATVLLQADSARISGTLGAYVNVHTAANLADVPLCASVLTARTTPTGQTPRPAAQATLQQTVKIGDNLFLPAALSVVAGTTVTWTHTGKVTHNVVSIDLPGLRSADLHPGESFSYTFKTPGTFTYYCSYHDGMSATITVTNR